MSYVLILFYYLFVRCLFGSPALYMCVICYRYGVLSFPSCIANLAGNWILTPALHSGHVSLHPQSTNIFILIVYCSVLRLRCPVSCVSGHVHNHASFFLMFWSSWCFFAKGQNLYQGRVDPSTQTVLPNSYKKKPLQPMISVFFSR